MKNFKIGTSEIGLDQPCYVIAEIGHNHQGKLSLAIELIEEAAECGVHAVKFQKRDLKQLYTDQFLNEPYASKNSYGDTYGEHREVLEFNFDEMMSCKKRAEQLNLDFIITPFDLSSLDFCEKIGVKYYKIASGDLTNHQLITAIAKLEKPIIISAGASSLNEIKETCKLLSTFNCPFALLYAVSSYPANLSDLNLKRIKELQALFPSTPIGYSGHDLGIEATKIARSMGAMIIEKHFTLDHSLKGTDQSFSLDPTEMKNLVEQLIEMDLILGTSYAGDDQLNNYELDARRKLGKGVYANQKIEADTILTNDLFVIKSPGTKLTPNKVESILGKRTTQSIPEGAPIDLMDLT